MEENPISKSPEGETSCVKNDNTLCQPGLLEYLSSAYEVLRRIFSYLYLEDVMNAAEAFESWKPAADVTRKERSAIESFFISHKRFKISRIWSEAEFCICFCTAPNKEVEEKVKKFITPTGEFLHCHSGAGVIGTMHDLSQILQQKVRVGLSVSYKSFYLTALRIPRVPKVQIKTYVWEDGMDFEEFKKNVDIPSDQIIKCLLVFMVDEGSTRMANVVRDEFIQYLQSRQKENFAVGGCVIDSINYSTVNICHVLTKYIVFYGENVEAASTLLTADVKSLTEINNRVKRLKDMCPITNKGALFVFRCNGRQRVLRRCQMKYDISKWETDALQNHFPNTPVIGCFSYGEFGREHPFDEDYLKPKRSKRPSDWVYSFSTSIVYVGFMQ